MRTFVITMSVANLVLTLLWLVGKFAERRSPALLDTLWADLIALCIFAAMATWALAIMGVLLDWVGQQSRLLPIICLWLIVSGVTIAWLLIEAARFVNPNWPGWGPWALDWGLSEESV